MGQIHEISSGHFDGSSLSIVDAIASMAPREQAALKSQCRRCDQDTSRIWLTVLLRGPTWDKTVETINRDVACNSDADDPGVGGETEPLALSKCAMLPPTALLVGM